MLAGHRGVRREVPDVGEEVVPRRIVAAALAADAAQDGAVPVVAVRTAGRGVLVLRVPQAVSALLHVAGAVAAAGVMEDSRVVAADPDRIRDCPDAAHRVSDVRVVHAVRGLIAAPRGGVAVHTARCSLCLGRGVPVHDPAVARVPLPDLELDEVARRVGDVRDRVVRPVVARNAGRVGPGLGVHAVVAQDHGIGVEVVVERAPADAKVLPATDRRDPVGVIAALARAGGVAAPICLLRIVDGVHRTEREGLHVPAAICVCAVSAVAVDRVAARADLVRGHAGVGPVAADHAVAAVRVGDALVQGAGLAEVQTQVAELSERALGVGAALIHGHGDRVLTHDRGARGAAGLDHE